MRKLDRPAKTEVTQSVNWESPVAYFGAGRAYVVGSIMRMRRGRKWVLLRIAKDTAVRASEDWWSPPCP